MRIHTVIFDKKTGEIYHESTTKNIFDLTQKETIFVSSAKIYFKLLQRYPCARLNIIPLGDDTLYPNLFNKFNY